MKWSRFEITVSHVNYGRCAVNSDAAVISVGDYGRCAVNSDAQHSILICAHLYYAFCGFNVVLCPFQITSSSAKLDLKGVWYLVRDTILWNSMTSTSCVFTELANTMKYGGGFLYNLVFTEWRHCVSQNEVWGRGYYITLFSPSDVTAFHRILWNAVTSSETLLNGYSVKTMLYKTPSPILYCIR